MNIDISKLLSEVHSMYSLFGIRFASCKWLSSALKHPSKTQKTGRNWCFPGPTIWEMFPKFVPQKISDTVDGRNPVPPTLNGRSHTNNLPGHLCPMELRPPRAKKSHTQSSSAWNAVQNRKMFQLQKNREVQTQWNTSHTHLERGTNFIIIQVRLHHRTAWNAAFTTWKKAAQNLHFMSNGTLATKRLARKTPV